MHKTEAHSCILAANSTVFNTMLTTEMMEKSSGIIKLKKGVNEEVFNAFLAFLYENNSTYSSNNDIGSVGVYPWNPNGTLEILQLAHQYQVLDLFEYCLDTLIGFPDSEYEFQSAMNIFKAGNLYDQKDLVSRASQYFKRELRSSEEGVVCNIKDGLKAVVMDDNGEATVSFVINLL